MWFNRAQTFIPVLHTPALLQSTLAFHTAVLMVDCSQEGVLMLRNAD